jgi:hypothetical protein
MNLKQIFFMITGGRPMIFKESLFQDFISKEIVNLYVDQSGRYWMATGKWSRFRFKTKRRN